MTNAQILRVALEQSAIDCNCSPEDFLKDENTVTLSRVHPKARAYLPLPFKCDLVTYGRGIVAQTSQELSGAVKKFIDSYPNEHCFETPNIHALDVLIAPYGLKTCFMAEYFLPDIERLKELECDFELKVLTPADFSELYIPRWSNALCEKRRELDTLAVGAYDGETLIGLAGCSRDCETMYQIGVDVLAEYRHRGVAAAVTSKLALEILALGKVPFYCAAWSNIASVRNALKCGFKPAWASLTARDIDFVKEMNKIR
ncbi:MAG: GNAT family N-acetyltransferase [Oscillospiraceae bacterium]|nr:GNAT family N-acetyltransferase [Oscillospiraceae bacterium]